ncbi:MAG: hypothetical protein ACL93V_00305 [Candidatus Electrothrix sp. YB6]
MAWSPVDAVREPPLRQELILKAMMRSGPCRGSTETDRFHFIPAGRKSKGPLIALIHIDRAPNGMSLSTICSV